LLPIKPCCGFIRYLAFKTFFFKTLSLELRLKSGKFQAGFKHSGESVLRSCHETEEEDGLVVGG
jgi:hypothetical protein